MRQLTNRQLAEWEAYWNAEPWGAALADQHNASSQALLANVNRDSRKHSPFKTEDFRLIKDESREVTQEEANRRIIVGLCPEALPE